MDDDIQIVRDGNAYRLLHGQLHLVNALNLRDEIFVSVYGEGQLKVVRTRQGYFAVTDHQCLPIHRH